MFAICMFTVLSKIHGFGNKSCNLSIFRFNAFEKVSNYTQTIIEVEQRVKLHGIARNYIDLNQ